MLWPCVVIVCSAFTAGAQTQYANTQCIKVVQGKDADYRKYVAAVAKPTAQARADAGEFAARLRLRAMYPAGTEAACDYQLIDLYTSFPPDPAKSMSRGDAQKKAGLTISEIDALAMRDASIRLRKMELWRVLEAMGTPQPGNYMRLDYMKVASDQGPAWVKNEREIWKPAHKARIEMNALMGWAPCTLSMPSGSSLPYNAMTANLYTDWSQAGSPSKYADAFKKTQPNLDMAETVANSAKLREIVRTELYVVDDVVRAKK